MEWTCCYKMGCSHSCSESTHTCPIPAARYPFRVEEWEEKEVVMLSEIERKLQFIERDSLCERDSFLILWLCENVRKLESFLGQQDLE